MKVLLVAITLIVLSGASFYFFKNKTAVTTETPKATQTVVPAETNNVEIKATFKIITNGTVRIFTDSKYHNQSSDVYIEKSNPSVINVKKLGITWGDFFKTLPMSLDKKCLITGTKQTFCTQDGKVLSFEINGVENPDALDEIIENGDSLLVTFE